MTRKFSQSLGCHGLVDRDLQQPTHIIRFDVFRTRHKLETRTKGKYMAGDQELMCSDCGQSFTFTSEDQAFFNERGYSTPKRCKQCRQAKKQEQSGGGGYQRSESRGTSVICAGCGQQTTVPFEPRGDRPVYCQNCFQARKKTDSGGAGRRNFGRGR